MKRLFLVLLISFFAFTTSAFAAVNLNTATQAELETIKGIGPAKAKAIIDYRTKNGQFKTVDDLDNVKGFGKKSIDKIRSNISVSGATTTPAPAPTKAKAEEKPAAAPAADAPAEEKKTSKKKKNN